MTGRGADAVMGGVAELEPQFKAMLDKERVPASFTEWLTSDGFEVLSMRAFAACAPSKEKVDGCIIDASGVTGLTYGNKVSIRFAWESAVNYSNSNPSGAGSSAGPSSLSKMPAGSEVMLRKKFKEVHGMSLNGS